MLAKCVHSKVLLADGFALEIFSVFVSVLSRFVSELVCARACVPRDVGLESIPGKPLQTDRQTLPTTNKQTSLTVTQAEGQTCTPHRILLQVQLWIGAAGCVHHERRTEGNRSRALSALVSLLSLCFPPPGAHLHTHRHTSSCYALLKLPDLSKTMVFLRLCFRGGVAGERADCFVDLLLKG